MPFYSLDEIKALVVQGSYHVTGKARQDALEIGFGAEEVRDCVLALDESHFYKYMPAEKVTGLYQDVYKIRYESVRVYLKLQINFDRNAVVISFKEDTGREW